MVFPEGEILRINSEFSPGPVLCRTWTICLAYSRGDSKSPREFCTPDIMPVLLNNKFNLFYFAFQA